LKKNKKKACGMAMDETGIIASAGAILGASEERSQRRKLLESKRKGR
jgi:hypothetical protein